MFLFNIWIQGIKEAVISDKDGIAVYEGHICDCEGKCRENIHFPITKRGLRDHIEEGISKVINHHFSEETLKKMNKSHTGKITSEETKAKQRKANTGKHRSKKQRENISQSKIGKNVGEDSSHWKGGKCAFNARRRNLGYEPFNKFFEGSSPHHLDKNFVIHIPKEIHKSIWHDQNIPETMEVINALSWNFYTEQWFKENNIKF